jgi:hypothetical protein
MGAIFSLIGGPALFNAGAGILKALIEFFKTPVGQVVGLGLLIIAAYVGGKIVEHHKLTVKHKAEIVALNNAWTQREKDAAAKYETARKQRDDAISKEIRGQIEGQLSAAQQTNDELARQLDELTKERANAKGVYHLTDDDIARILRVRSAGDKQPAPAAVNRTPDDRRRGLRRMQAPGAAGAGANAAP